MRRTPLQQIGDMIGMYAYLAAMGGLRYWDGIRNADMADQAWPVPPPESVRPVEHYGQDGGYEVEREATHVG